MAAFSGKTKQSSVGSVSATPIVALTAAKSITVLEDPTVANWPTSALNVMKPASTDDPRQIPLGGSYTFTPNPGPTFAKGETVGYVILPTGSSSIIQDEV